MQYFCTSCEGFGQLTLAGGPASGQKCRASEILSGYEKVIYAGSNWRYPKASPKSAGSDDVGVLDFVVALLQGTIAWI